MENLLVFLLSFVFVFLCYLIIYFYKRIRGTLIKMKEINILSAKFNLEKSDIDVNKFCLLIVLVNSLIISITATICTMIELDYIWQLCIGFIILMILIYVIYGFIGKYLQKKKGMNKNESKRN
jgi:membrane protein implicated in regulation of membrane protease activity